MSVLYILLPLAVLLAGTALGAFLYSVSRGQFDDLDTPPLRAIFDDPPTGLSPSEPTAPPRP